MIKFIKQCFLGVKGFKRILGRGRLWQEPQETNVEYRRLGQNSGSKVLVNKKEK